MNDELRAQIQERLVLLVQDYHVEAYADHEVIVEATEEIVALIEAEKPKLKQVGWYDSHIDGQRVALLDDEEFEPCSISKPVFIEVSDSLDKEK